MSDIPEVWMGIALNNERHELVFCTVAKTQAEADQKTSRRMPGRPSFVFSINGDTSTVWKRLHSWLADQRVPHPNRLTRQFWRIVSQKIFN